MRIGYFMYEIFIMSPDGKIIEKNLLKDDDDFSYDRSEHGGPTLISGNDSSGKPVAYIVSERHIVIIKHQ